MVWAAATPGSQGKEQVFRLLFRNTFFRPGLALPARLELAEDPTQIPKPELVQRDAKGRGGKEARPQRDGGPSGVGQAVPPRYVCEQDRRAVDKNPGPGRVQALGELKGIRMRSGMDAGIGQTPKEVSWAVPRNAGVNWLTLPTIARRWIRMTAYHMYSPTRASACSRKANEAEGTCHAAIR